MQGPPVHLGNAVPADASRLQQLMAEHATLSQADPSSAVKRTGWGYEIQPPEQSPSRVRQALTGALHGAAMAGAGGDPWAALGGAATGAAAGGVSPALMQAFQRRLELDRSTGDLATEQKLQLGNAQIGETLAQAEQRRLEPFLKAEELRRQDERARATEEGRNRRNETTNRTRAQTAAEANRLRQAQLEETERHNRAVEARPPSNTDRTVNNAIYRRDADGVYRLAPGSPAPSPTAADDRRTERSADREAKGKQAAALYQKGAEYWDTAKAKRAEADRLGRGADGQPSRIAARANEAAIKALTNEAESLERQTREVQLRGDLLAAEAESGPAQPAAGGRSIQGAIEAFRTAKKREPTADEIRRMEEALKRSRR